jgi:hypothetical protein
VTAEERSVVEHSTSSPLAAYREDPLLFLLTLSAAVTSIAALLLQLAGIIRMPYTLSFVTAPGMIFLLCVQIWAGRAGRPLIVNRLRVGFVAGLIGLVAYNGTRWVVGTHYGKARRLHGRGRRRMAISHQ